MIFRQIDEILDGRKTQTRRTCKPGEVLDKLYIPGFGTVPAVWVNDRLKWVVGRTYAIQPKRGAPGIKTHRIQITGIRQERLQDISEEDALAEGVSGMRVEETGNIVDGYEFGIVLGSAIDAYRELWDSINTRKGVRWEDNPLCWVIEFECVEDADA